MPQDKLYRPEDAARIIPASSKPENEPWRTPWRQDFARLLHSASFRRLQGKQQLFPGHESDFFRNRLTHSLEVAQVAKSIAIRINATSDAFADDNAINTDIVETAALAHDLGHPPFGHNGEEALNHCMRKHGGFEGNAQTLRILSKLEKKSALRSDHDEFLPVKDGKDRRAGLNLTYRTLASVLKYDKKISKDICHSQNDTAIVQKGYYFTEADLVKKIKEHVVEPIYCSSDFKVVECSIMDIADDIAYSTYDLEDSFKAGFLSPMRMIAAPDTTKEEVAKVVRERIEKYYPNAKAEDKEFDSSHVLGALLEIFGSHLAEAGSGLNPNALLDDETRIFALSDILQKAYKISKRTSEDGYYRTGFTSELVGRFISGVTVEINKDCLPLSRAKLDLGTFKLVEVLKNYTYVSQIESSKLKVSEYRGKDIVENIFEALVRYNGHKLLPDDCRALYQGLRSEHDRYRLICDFIANMTDRYAIKFYSRLYSTSEESIFAPL